MKRAVASEAEEELTKAALWYEERRDGLPHDADVPLFVPQSFGRQRPNRLQPVLHRKGSRTRFGDP